MKFILTLHAATSWNEAGRNQGQTDIELSEMGNKQAVELAEKSLRLDITKIICSDLKRSSQTAEIIGERLGLPVSNDERLRECSFGKFEGLTDQEMIAKGEEDVARDLANQGGPYDFTEYGGEDSDTVLIRHMKLLEELRGEGEKTVLIVGHTRGLSTLLKGLGITKTIERGKYLVIDYYGES